MTAIIIIGLIMVCVSVTCDMMPLAISAVKDLFRG